MSRAQFHLLSISKTRELPDGVAITFDIPDKLFSTFKYIPGQYVTLEASINNKIIRRTYSICSYHQDNCLEIGIKRIEQGVFSNYALSLKPGDQLKVMPPEGRFIRPIDEQKTDDQKPAHTLLVAAGSGITPCLSIAKSVLADEKKSKITLLNGNKTINSIMFRADIAALKDDHTERFNVINMLSQEKQDIERFNGRISATAVRDLNADGLIIIGDFDNAYLCGPMDMVNSIRDTLLELGMQQEQVHTELFTTEKFDAAATNNAFQTQNTIKHKNGAGQHQVTIMLDGLQTDINVDSSTDTVLSAAQSAGIDMPFSCAGGMCCTCRCKVLEGKAIMDANFSLADWEVEAGYMLACQARPSTDKLVLDFDSV